MFGGMTEASFRSLAQHRCGPLSRRSDGSWWCETTYLGCDGAPELAAHCLESSLAVVTLRLVAGLKRASKRLGELGAVDVEVEGLLERFGHWRLTGQWPIRLWDELRTTLTEFQGSPLARIEEASDLLRRLVELHTQGRDLASLIAEVRAWLR